MHVEYFGYVCMHTPSRMAKIFMDLTQEVVGLCMQSTLVQKVDGAVFLMQEQF